MQPTCPHCSTPVSVVDAFCVSCGMALHDPNFSGPRLLKAGEVATTSAGMAVQILEIERLCRAASNSLIAVAFLTMLWTLLLMGFAASAVGMVSAAIYATMAGGIAILFLGLGLWARRSPLPASIVGLVAFMSLWAMEIASDPYSIWSGIIIRVIVIAVLVRGVHAGILANRIAGARVERLTQ